MSVQNLSSRFGAIARGAALALAVTGSGLAGSAAYAQDAATPGDTAQPGLPTSCIPFADSGRDVGPQTANLKKFMDGLQAYEGWQGLTDRLDRAGIRLDGVCAIMASPQRTTSAVVLDRTSHYTALDINITGIAKTPDGGMALIPAPPEKVAEGIDSVFLPEAIKTLAASTAGDLTLPTDNLDTTVALFTVMSANAIAEEGLYAVDSYERTGSDAALSHLQNGNATALYNDEINDLWTAAINHEADNTVLTQEEKDAFRVAVVTKALKDPDLRKNSYVAAVQMMVNMVMAGMADPSASFTAQPTAAELTQRLGNLGPAVANMDITGIVNTLKSQDGDPSGPANAALARMMGKLNTMMNGQPAPGGQDQAPAAPATPTGPSL